MAEEAQTYSIPWGRETTALVAGASQAQAAKVRVVLDNIDRVAALEPERMKNITDLMRAAVADGGCGIGCW